ncbi:sel1 repeat family protein [Zavarzinia compransoris]|uniref:tetratricopeptide repeat protein n=1 Tax=Zavarzinia marina TaxID=2911065 RepID=UPI001F3EF61B|nr:tetratricopeptide repeat protein [Zavarzinia marina]MCF4167697.1 sel1 repeat family protein [Zavarzinia marina]
MTRRARILAAALTVSGTLSAGSAWAEITECDRLAASPTDVDRPAPVKGVAIIAIDVRAAVPACREAMAANPEIARYKYQLARALAPGNDQMVAESTTLLTEAAEAGYPDAMYFLGVMKRSGFGVPRDVAAAFQLFLKAAEAGHPRAMQALGKAYTIGEGTKADAVAAADWFREGALAGDAESMTMLGHAYLDGAGVPKDIAQAKDWYRRAIDAGSKTAAMALDRAEKMGGGN